MPYSFGVGCGLWGGVVATGELGGDSLLLVWRRSMTAGKMPRPPGGEVPKKLGLPLAVVAVEDPPIRLMSLASWYCPKSRSRGFYFLLIREVRQYDDVLFGLRCDTAGSAAADPI